MSFRFFKRVKVMPGMTVNFSKSGASLSFGRRGAHYTIGPRGQRATVGIPGTGLYYTQATGWGRKRGSASTGQSPSSTGPAAPSRAATPSVKPEDRLDLGFWKRLTTPPEERELVAGIKAMVTKNESEALAHFRQATQIADGAFLAGFLSYGTGDLQRAVTDLRSALDRSGEVGSVLAKYGASATLSLAITDSVVVHLQPGEEAVLLVLVEAYQRLGQFSEALSCCERLRQLVPDDVVVKVSFAELLLDQWPNDTETARRVIELTDDLTNDSPIHAAALLYRGRALRILGTLEAALEILTSALSRRADRSPDLMHALRYERALTYEALGRPRRARSDLERIYGEDPHFEDVAARLGVGATPAPSGPAQLPS